MKQKQQVSSHCFCVNKNVQFIVKENISILLANIRKKNLGINNRVITSFDFEARAFQSNKPLGRKEMFI